jgi:membrane-associated phospholipid phosphatase
MKNGNKLSLKKVSFKVLLFSFLFLCSIALFALLAHEVVGENEDWFDTRVFNFLKDRSSHATIIFFKYLTFLGSTYFLLSAYVVVVGYLFLKHRIADAIDIAIIGITSFALLQGLKVFFARHRPPLPLFDALSNYSFPSGHALSSFIFCSVLIRLVWKSHWNKKWKYLLSGLLILLAILIGISRIVLRYHYASDVVAGFCLGFAWVLFSFWLQGKIRKKLPERENQI